ncbi:hypothetical protein FB567DRAFT_630709 [Paraphoma chrysanthemicola]|uniref:Zn(2)-C6 fungal-type domain-containing protein n=1 Tax=Paraphoma chrysanthemicola TaxID=798071 RepID=A0A8K0R104_9PLEO|nr:hypothetical protein FB567DRAFT_630709 [Paraphoma chrysanthemicola]
MQSSTQLGDGASWKHARYHCSVCCRPFDRKDVLSRHMRVHDAHRPPPGARRKACQSCVQSKTRCNGERPKCSSCVRRKLPCIFEGAAGSRRQDGRQNNGSVISLAPDSTQHVGSDQPLLESSMFANAQSMTTPPPSEAQINEIDLNQDGTNIYSPKSGLTVAANLPSPTSGGLTSDLMFMAFDNPDFNSNLDWILENSGSEHSRTDMGFLNTLSSHDDPLSQLLLISAPQTASLPAMNTTSFDVQGDGTALGGLLVPQPQHTVDHGDPWPLENSGPPLKEIVLPSLGFDQVDARGRYHNLMPINDRTWHALQKCLRLPFEQNTLQTLNLESFPPKEDLDHCIDLYFAHFHPMLSFIHLPTFDPGRDLVVTLAIICIGVCYTQFPGSKAFSITLSELSRRLLVFMAEHDHRFVRTQSYLAAQLLQGIHGYSSGSERLFELSESCRNSLIYHTKCMGLFRSETQASPPTGCTLEETWQAYIRAESSRRLSWAVFTYDASVAYLHNNRPFLNIADVNLNLPGSIEHWQAENAEIWASLHPWSRNTPPTSSLRSTMSLLFDGSPDPVEKIADEQHLFLIVLALLRMLWTMKEVRSFPLDQLATPLVSEDGVRTLLQAIDQTLVPIEAISNSHTRAEIEQLVHRTQLVHIAHIYAAGDLMNWLFPYLRDDLESGTIKLRMRQWANEDPQRTREITFHSAQLLGLVRLYPSQMPLQSFHIFHAGVVLSCMSFLLPESHSPVHGPSLQLDQPRLDADAPNRHVNWTINGENVNLCLVGVPSLCSPVGRQQVLNQTASLLKRQKTWGIAHNLTKVVLSLNTRYE